MTPRLIDRSARLRLAGARMLTVPVLAAGLAVLAGLGALALPAGVMGVAELRAEDDPARLTQLRLPEAASPKRIAAEIEDALAQGDEDLAQSFLDLADAQSVAVDPARRARVWVAVAQKRPDAASDLLGGFATGNNDSWAGTAGAITADLIGYSDLRDLWQEGNRLAKGEDYDRFLLGMSVAGIALTGATIATLGTSAPATVPAARGIGVLKTARRAGLLSRAMMARLGRMTSEVVDAGALRQAVAAARALDLPAARQAVWGAIRPNGMRTLRRIGADTMALEARLGQRGLVQTLGVARDARELSRARRLAETMGRQTRAALKLLGPAALALGNVTAFLLQAVWLALAWSLAVALWARRFGLTLGRVIWGPRPERRVLPVVPSPLPA